MYKMLKDVNIVTELNLLRRVFFAK